MKTQEFLLKYSKIPKEEQSKHVHEIRDRAWAIRSYPCTGIGVWLVPYIPSSEAYSDIIKRLQSGGILLDVGCFLGTDLRQLVYDGAPSDKMYGVDIANHWEVGFDMYRDRDSFKGHFIEGDIMQAEENEQLATLKGKVDIISISALMHQFDYDRQLECAKHLVPFSKPGCIVVGHQMGNTVAKVFTLQPQGVVTWRHDPPSFSKMWEEVGAQTGTKWETKARLLRFDEIGWDPNDSKFMGDDTRIIDWVVTRTA